jgi:putative nucleotidyltransferase-like protein
VTSSPVDREAKVDAAANNIRVDAATAEVLQSFDASGIGSVVLKGPALSPWYAGDLTRAYLDCDLWVRPRDLGGAELELTRLGFVRLVDGRGLPDWWQEHASTWWREADGVIVDLHRNLQGLGVGPQRAWEVLTANTNTVNVAGYPAPIFSVPARALYVTLHAGHHGTAWGKALIHVERALAAVDEAAWREATALAGRLDALDAFAAGLRLTAEGATLADRMDLPATQSVKVALRATSPPPIALGFEQLASSGGWRTRLQIIFWKAFPPPGFVRHWWPPAARNRRMLVLAYFYRPIWLLRNAPAGLRAWRAARRQVSSSRNG